MKKIVQIALTFSILIGWSQDYAPSQIWTQFQIEQKLTDANFIQYEIGYRFHPITFESRQSLLRLAYTRKIKSKYSFTSGLASFQNFQDSLILWENRLFQDLNLNYNLKRIIWNMRFRCEEHYYWKNEYSSDGIKIRFRLRSGIEIPSNLFHKKFRFGLNDEVFYEIGPNGNRRIMNRILPVLGIELSEYHSLTVNYNHQKVWMNQDSQTTPIFWLSYKIKVGYKK